MIRTILTYYAAAMRRVRIRRDPIGYARSVGVKMGKNCRLLGLTPATFGSEPYLVTLGDHVTVTAGVKFITHDGGVWVFREHHPNIELVAPISIGNNVFIGIDSIIMPGVKIGDNCVIGAGAVVSRDIPSGSVAVGVPARPVKTIDEYWAKVKSQALHTRALNDSEKKEFYTRR